MANIQDYVNWRGDLSFDAAAFNEVDNVILSELAYMDFGGIATDQGVTLTEAARLFFSQGRGEELEKTALFQADELCPLLRCAAKGSRFGTVRILTPVQLVDDDVETQFSATAFDLGKSGIYLAYSGTDDTLAGWKEDFNLSYMDSVPAQHMALEYLVQMAAAHPERPVLLGGHSKGGNLALYAALNAPEELLSRIQAVYSNDGPGLRNNVCGSAAYSRLQNKICCLVPQDSVIGMLLEHPGDCKAVYSTQKGILQHDAFSWQTGPYGFEAAAEETRELTDNEKALRELVGGLTEEQLRDFTNALFEILAGSGATTTTELRDEGLSRCLPAMLKAYGSLDGETRRLVWDTMEHIAGESARIKLRRLRRDMWGYLMTSGLERLRRKPASSAAKNRSAEKRAVANSRKEKKKK